MAHRQKMNRPHWLRGVVSDSFGVRGGKNIAAWLVAGTLAYYLYLVPERQRRQEQHEAREWARRLAAEAGWPERDSVKPIADPQDTGLIRGSSKRK